MSTFASAPSQTVQLSGFASAVAAGPLAATPKGAFIAVVIVAQLASGNSASVTDNVGNVYTLVPLLNPGTSQRHVEIWFVASAKAGVTTVTVNTGTSANVAGNVLVYNSGSTGLRASASLSNATSATPPAAAPVALAGDLTIGALGYQAATSGVRQDTLTSAGFTPLTPVTRGTTIFAGAQRVITADGAQGPTWSMSPAVATGEVTAVFAPSRLRVWTGSAFVPTPRRVYLAPGNWKPTPN